jgi:hypothetical protein
VKARKPARDFCSRQRRVAHLTVLLRSLASGEDAGRQRTRAREFTHDAVHPIDIEKMVVFPLRDENTLLHMVQDGVSANRLYGCGQIMLQSPDLPS